MPDVESILKALKDRENRTAMVFAHELQSVTYLQMRQRSVKCALWLRSQNVCPGDIITVLPSNTVDFYVPFLAGLYIGAVMNMWDVNCKLNIDALRRIRPKVIFADKRHVLEMYALIAFLLRDNFQTTVVIFQSQNHFSILDVILHDFTDIDVENFVCSPMRNPRDTAVILRTFDMMTVENNIEVPYAAFLNPFYTNMLFMQKCSIGLWYANLGSYQELFIFSNAIASHVQLIVWWKRHYLLVHGLLRDFQVEWVHFNHAQASGWFKIINNLHKIGMANVPSLAYILYTYDVKWSTVQTMISDMLKANVLVMYCYPEIGPVSFAYNPSEICCIGEIIEEADLKIHIEGKMLAEPGEIGEICCKSTYIMNGYYLQNATTRFAITDGWLYTKDLGFYTEDDEIHVIGDARLPVKFQNKTVNVERIETFLENVKAARYVIVMPLADSVDGHLPFAFIQKSDEWPMKQVYSINERNVKQLVELFLPDSCRLRGGVRLLKNLRFYNNIEIKIKWMYWVIKTYVQEESLSYL